MIYFKLKRWPSQTTRYKKKTIKNVVKGLSVNFLCTFSISESSSKHQLAYRVVQSAVNNTILLATLEHPMNWHILQCIFWSFCCKWIEVHIYLFGNRVHFNFLHKNIFASIGDSWKSMKTLWEQKGCQLTWKCAQNSIKQSVIVTKTKSNREKSKKNSIKAKQMKRNRSRSQK